MVKGELRVMETVLLDNQYAWMSSSGGMTGESDANEPKGESGHRRPYANHGQRGLRSVSE